MHRAIRWAALLLVLSTALASAQNTKYALKQAQTPPPKELDPSIQKLLAKDAVQFLDPQGNLLAELWFRTEIPADATPEQVKNGVTYREIPQTTLLGAVRFDKNWSDYRKQNIKAGVYTIRLAFQPQDGDHMGTAPYPEFGVLLSAAKDTKAATMEPKMMQELSAASIGTSHPGVLLLFPNPRPGAAPELAAKANNHLVLNTKEGVSIQGKAASGVLGVGLTLVGHTE